MSTPYLKIENLSKCFHVAKEERTSLRAIGSYIRGKAPTEAKWALKDISFELAEGEKLGLVGVNGSGKSTLLRILSGIFLPTSGLITMQSRPRSLLQIGIGLNVNISVEDNIYLYGAMHGLRRKKLEEKIDDILSASEIKDLRYTSPHALSDGQLRRLSLSVFFHCRDDFMLFDECLNFIDKNFIANNQKCFDETFRSKKTLIISSHGLSFLRNYCTKILWLDHGQIRMYDTADKVLSAYENFSD